MHTLSLKDILTLYRCRNKVISLDYGTSLTRGSPFSPASILMHLDPSHERFTAVSTLPKGEPALFGQMSYKPAAHQARMIFLAPEENIYTPALASLVEVLLKQAGEWGVLHLTAEVEERADIFQSLRKVGFAVFTRQRIWRLKQTKPMKEDQRLLWELPQSADELQVRLLYDGLVPAIVQQVENFTFHAGQGLVYRHQGEVLAYVEGIFGPHGVLLQPYVHPEVEHVEELISQLPACFEPLFGRPVYIAVRSYQAWLDAPLEELNASPSPRLALMVRHLANITRLQYLENRKLILDNPQMETGAPAFQHFIHDN